MQQNIKILPPFLTQQLQGENDRAFSYSQRPSHWASGPGCVLDWVCHETQRGRPSQNCSPWAELDSVSFTWRHWLSHSHSIDCDFCDCQKLHVLFQEVLQENSEKEEWVDTCSKLFFFCGVIVRNFFFSCVLWDDHKKLFFKSVFCGVIVRNFFILGFCNFNSSMTWIHDLNKASQNLISVNLFLHYSPCVSLVWQCYFKSQYTNSWVQILWKCYSTYFRKHLWSWIFLLGYLYSSITVTDN